MICSGQYKYIVGNLAFALLLLLITPYDIEGFAQVAVARNRIPQISQMETSFTRRKSILFSAATSVQLQPAEGVQGNLNRIQASGVKVLMIAYITAMCIALPMSLFPVFLLHKSKIINKVRKEKLSLKVVQFCSRWLMFIFPFASKTVVVNADDDQLKKPEPFIWVCNHISMLDLFFMLALDNQMRGKDRRPIKILYWRGLESNPITRIFCKMCGFIPVDMANNGNGNANEYDSKSFRPMLKSVKDAIAEGFDIGILPEGQPNPTPEKGLQPVFSGAFTIARMSQRPIKMIGLYGLHHMWHPSDKIGMNCTARDMAVRVYPNGRTYKDAEEFASTFDNVVGYFGAHGRDMPEKELQMWLDGSMWQTELSRRKATRAAAEDIERDFVEKKNEIVDIAVETNMETIN